MVVGVLAGAGGASQLALEVDRLALERAHPGDVGEGPGGRALVLGDLLGVERSTAQQVLQPRVRVGPLLLEVLGVGQRLEGEVVEATHARGALRLVDAPLAARVLGGSGLEGRPGAPRRGVGRAHPGQLDAGRGGLGRRDLGRGRGLHRDGLLDRGRDRGRGQLVQPGAQRLGVTGPVARGLVATDLADPADQVGDRALVLLRRTPQLDPPLAQPALGAVEAAGLEHLLEQGVALLRAGPEEGLEPPLWQERDLAELRERHPDQAGHQVTGLVEAGAQRVPGAVTGALGGVVAAASLGDDDPRLLGGRAGAPSLGTRPGR